MVTITERIKRLFADPISDRQPEPQTKIVSGSSENPFNRQGFNLSPNQDLFDSAKRRESVWKWRKIYQSGGPVSEAIDTYPLFVLSSGWQLVCNEGDEALKDRVQEWLDQPHMDLDGVMWQGVLDAVLCGTAFQEIVPTRSGDIWGLVPRDSASFRIKYDAYGRTTGYEQITFENGATRKTIPIEKDRILTLTLFPVPGEMYGVSLVGRAYDDIMRDCDMIESITKAVHRHGTPKYHISVGQPGDNITENTLKDIRKEFEEIAAKNDFVTGPDFSILNIDGTLSNLQEYSNLTLQRLATALGVPEEMLGLGRGSTEATANVRIKAFYDKITTIQTVVARTYSRGIIDRITGIPGSVWIEFNDPNAVDEGTKATWMAAIMTASGQNPFKVLPSGWVQEQFGITPEDYPVDEPPLQPAPFQQYFGQNQNQPEVDRENAFPISSEVRAVRAERTDAMKESELKLAAATKAWADAIMRTVEKDYPVK